jgi:hypothetical protein
MAAESAWDRAFRVLFDGDSPLSWSDYTRHVPEREWEDLVNVVALRSGDVVHQDSWVLSKRKLRSKFEKWNLSPQFISFLDTLDDDAKKLKNTPPGVIGDSRNADTYVRETMGRMQEYAFWSKLGNLSNEDLQETVLIAVDALERDSEDEETLGEDNEFDDESLAAATTVAYSVPATGALRPSRNTQAPPVRTSSIASTFNSAHPPAMPPQRTASNSSNNTWGYSPSGVDKLAYASRPPATLASGLSVAGPPPSYGHRSQAALLPGPSAMQETKDDLETIAEADTQMSSDVSGTSASPAMKQWGFEQLQTDRIREKEEYVRELRLAEETTDHWKLQAAIAASQAQTARDTTGRVQFEAQEVITNLRNEHVKKVGELNVLINQAHANHSIMYLGGSGIMTALQTQLDESRAQSQKLHEELVASRQNSEAWRVDAQGMRTQYDAQVALVASRNSEITRLEALRLGDSQAAQQHNIKIQSMIDEYRALLQNGQVKDASWQIQIDQERSLRIHREDELKRMNVDLTGARTFLSQAQSDNAVASAKLMDHEKRIQQLTESVSSWLAKCNEVEMHALGLEIRRSDAVSALEVAKREFDDLKKQAIEEVDKRNAAIATINASGDGMKIEVLSLGETVNKLSAELADALKSKEAMQEHLQRISKAQSEDPRRQQLSDALQQVSDGVQQIDALTRAVEQEREAKELAIRMKEVAVERAKKNRALAETQIEKLKTLNKSGPRIHAGSHSPSPSSPSRSPSPPRRSSSGGSVQARYLYTGKSKSKPAHL